VEHRAFDTDSRRAEPHRSIHGVAENRNAEARKMYTRQCSRPETNFSSVSLSDVSAVYSRSYVPKKSAPDVRMMRGRTKKIADGEVPDRTLLL
jgi:hypothetical protein